MLPRTCPICHLETLAYDADTMSCTNCKIYNRRLRWWERPLGWSAEKQWWWRLVVIFLFVVMWLQNIKDSAFALNRLSNPFSALDMGIHELGHRLFIPFGEFMTIAGGTILQLLFPLLWIVGFLQKKWYFAMSMCMCWLGLNFFDVATYAADARARELPLSAGPAALGISPDEMDAAYDSGHDWYQMLGRLDILQHDLAIASVFRTLGTISFIVGFLWGGVLIYHMMLGYKAIKRNQSIL